MAGTITILSGQTTSAPYMLGNYTVTGLRGPSAMTGTAITFQSADTISGTYMNLVDGENNAVGCSAAAAIGQQVAFSPVNTIGVKYLKLVSNASEGADRIFEIIQQEILGR